jgi:hypothetical protein
MTSFDYDPIAQLHAPINRQYLNLNWILKVCSSREAQQIVLRFELGVATLTRDQFPLHNSSSLSEPAKVS